VGEGGRWEDLVYLPVLAGRKDSRVQKMGAPGCAIIPAELNFLLAGGKKAALVQACAWI
jgi:hypothetical protein